MVDSNNTPNKIINTINKENTLIQTRDDKGIHYIKPFSSTSDIIHTFEKMSFIKQNKNKIAGIMNGYVYLYELNKENKFNEITKLEYDLVVKVDFSPNGKYLTIIQKPTIEQNLKIINIENNNKPTLYHSFSSNCHPGEVWPQLKYSDNNDYVFKRTTSTVEIFKANTDDNNNNKLELYGNIPHVILFDFSEIELSSEKKDIAIISIRTKIVENKKDKKTSKQHVISLFILSKLEKPIVEQPCSQASRGKILISPNKKQALINSISDESSSTSYYGNTAIYHIDFMTGKFQKISNIKTGTIHDFQFSSNGENFVLCAGSQPSSVYLFNSLKCSLTKEISKEKKVNTCLISPDNRMVLIAGLANLGGNIEVFQLKDYKQIGRIVTFGTHHCQWSNDSKLIMSAVTSPHLRVDNEYRMYSYNCEPVLNNTFKNEVYDINLVNNVDNNSNNSNNNLFDIEVSEKYKEFKKKDDKAKNEPSSWVMPTMNSNTIGMKKKK